MKDVFKMGLGALDIAYKEVEHVHKQLDGRYKTQIREGRRLIDDSIRKAKRDTADAHQRIKVAVKDAVGKSDVVAKDDIHAFVNAMEKLGTVTLKISTQIAKRASTRAGRVGRPRKSDAEKAATKAATKAKAKKKQ